MSLSAVLERMSQKYPRLSQRVQEAQALSRWEEAVGSSIARHARAFQVKKGVLWVEVSHPIWQQELQCRKNQILKRLNESSSKEGQKEGPDDKEVIQDLTFVSSAKARPKTVNWDPAKSKSRRLSFQKKLPRG